MDRRWLHIIIINEVPNDCTKKEIKNKATHTSTRMLSLVAKHK